MALRMFLVATVFAMSLPLPSRDDRQNLLNTVNQEIAAIVTAIRNELPRDDEHLLAESAAKIDKSTTPEVVAPLSMAVSEEVQRIESPLDLAFSVIVDEFAREATLANLDDVKNQIQIIAPEPVIVKALVPPPAAEDVIQDLVRIQTSSISEPTRVQGPVGNWSDFDLCVSEPDLITNVISENSLEESVILHRSLDPLSEEWQQEVAEFSTVKAVEDEQTLVGFSTENSPMSEEQWWDYSGLEMDISTNTTSVNTSDESREQPEIKKALRLTAEALAAWSHVFIRAY